MARSRLMSVPRKPEIISGPWLAAQVGWPGGTAQPKRTRPAHRPASSASAASASSERRAIGLGGLGRAADGDAPNLGPLRQVLPAKLIFILKLELIKQRLGVVIVDQHKA